MIAAAREPGKPRHDDAALGQIPAAPQFTGHIRPSFFAA
jgi:hypothetical protein